jgi:hypothetical protein
MEKECEMHTGFSVSSGVAVARRLHTAASAGAGATAGAVPGPPRFPEHERRALVLQTGLSEKLVRQLESASICSLDQLKSVGAQRAVSTVVARSGSAGWLSRVKPLQRAILRMPEE